MKKSLISFAETFISGVFIAIFTTIFVGQSLKITGDSMHPTLKDGERIIAEKVTYKSRDPQRGEIIVFRSLQNKRVFLIKRVIAKENDVLGLDNNILTINGKPYHDKQFSTFFENLDSLGKLKPYTETPIPKGYIAVMGDNRNESYDSRMFGLVPLENVVGRAWLVYWPLFSVRMLNYE